MPRTPIAAPVEVADAAEELVRNRRQTERKFWTEWDSARELRAAAGKSAAAVLVLRPCDCGNVALTRRLRPVLDLVCSRRWTHRPTPTSRS